MLSHMAQDSATELISGTCLLPQLWIALPILKTSVDDVEPARLAHGVVPTISFCEFGSRPSTIAAVFAVPYAAYHETGTKTKQGTPKMPRRGLLTADPDAGTLGAADSAALMREIERLLQGLLD